jgi:hypothetical protein
MTDKPDGKWRRWHGWATAALLIYLWGWLVLWSLPLAGFRGSNELLARIVFVLYWPIIQLMLLFAWFRGQV